MIEMVYAEGSAITKDCREIPWPDLCFVCGDLTVWVLRWIDKPVCSLACIDAAMPKPMFLIASLMDVSDCEHRIVR